jgi:hypothetical protein
VSINASIITDTAKDITKRTVVNYGAGVFAHTTQDWAKHNCVLIPGRTQFTASGEVVTNRSLRLLVTLDNGSSTGLDMAVLCPINAVGTSAITNSAPIIIQQPASKVTLPNSTVQLIVAVISDIAVTYQWYKKNASSVFVALTGKTASSMVLTDVTETDSGDYHVVATNANGSTTSFTATLVVSSGASGSQGEGFFEQLPGVKLAKKIFGFF